MRERPDLRQEFVGDEIDHLPQPLRIGAEGRMHVEAVAAAGAGACRARRAPDGRRSRTRRATRSPPTSGLSAARSFRKSFGRLRSRMFCESATVAMWPLRPNSSRSVRASMMTSATSPANWMSLAPMVSSTRSRRAVGAMLARGRERLGQRRDLRARRRRAGGVGARARAFGDALRAEEAGGDRRARAGERNEGDGDVRVLDREAERGAHLVAVERAVARAASASARSGAPRRRHAGPIPRSRRSGCRCSRRVRAGNTRWSRRRGSGGSRSLRRRAAPAGRDCLRRRRSSRRARRSARRAPGSRSRRAGRCRPAARCRRVAVVGRPCTTRSRISSSHEPSNCRGSLEPSSNVQTQSDGVRRRRGEHDADAMVAGRQIDLACAVALAEFHQPAGAIDAQPLDRVARPAAAVALDAQAAARNPARRRCARTATWRWKSVSLRNSRKRFLTSHSMRGFARRRLRERRTYPRLSESSKAVRTRAARRMADADGL